MKVHEATDLGELSDLVGIEAKGDQRALGLPGPANLLLVLVGFVIWWLSRAG